MNPAELLQRMKWEGGLVTLCIRRVVIWFGQRCFPDIHCESEHVCATDLFVEYIELLRPCVTTTAGRAGHTDLRRLCRSLGL